MRNYGMARSQDEGNMNHKIVQIRDLIMLNFKDILFSFLAQMRNEGIICLYYTLASLM